MRAHLALAAIRRLHALTAEIKATRSLDIAAAAGLRPHQHLMAIPGVGPLVAAKILGETHDARHFRSAAAFAAHAGTAPVPASSGNTTRHRLARGGNRQLNRALFTIAMIQARWHPDARAYLARKRAEGKSRQPKPARCLKRHLAAVVYRAMLRDLTSTIAVHTAKPQPPLDESGARTATPSSASSAPSWPSSTTNGPSNAATSASTSWLDHEPY